MFLPPLLFARIFAQCQHFKGQPPERFAGPCLADEDCKFANAECRSYIGGSGTCYCVSDFQFNGKDCLPTEENDAWQKGYGAVCEDSTDCKFAGAECNQNKLCVCQGEQYFDTKQSACISRKEYRARSPKETTSPSMEQTESPEQTEPTIEGMQPEKVPCIENATSTTVTTAVKVRMTTKSQGTTERQMFSTTSTTSSRSSTSSSSTTTTPSTIHLTETTTSEETPTTVEQVACEINEIKKHF